MTLPDILWHGTTAAFDLFDARYLGRMVRNPTTEFGFFFSEDPQDAASWAWRAIERRQAQGEPRLLQVKLDLAKPIRISGPKFQFYLQRARCSTIQRDRKAWIASGHDGLSTTRGDHRWWCVFDPARVTILAAEPLERPEAEAPQPF